MSNVALTANDYANSAGDLLEIYDSLFCPDDRNAVRLIIEREFATYSKQINLSVEAVNLGIGYTKKPGIAAEAIRMRDELQEFKSLLDSTKLSIQPAPPAR